MIRCYCCKLCIIEDEHTFPQDYDGQGSPTTWTYDSVGRYLYTSGNSFITGNVEAPAVSPATDNSLYAVCDVYFTAAGDTVWLSGTSMGEVSVGLTTDGTDGTVTMEDPSGGGPYASDTVVGLGTGSWCRICIRWVRTSSTTHDYTATASYNGTLYTLSVPGGTLGSPTSVSVTQRKWSLLTAASNEVRVRHLIWSVDNEANSDCDSCQDSPAYIGYFGGTWGVENAVSSIAGGVWMPLVNLNADISRITECVAVFGGLNNQCGNWMNFSSLDWATIKSYVEGGGRLFIALEHNTCFIDGSSTFASFMSYVGGTMGYGGGDYNGSGPECSSDYYSAGAAAVMSGLECSGERFGSITGGTTMFIGNVDGSPANGNGVVAGAIEAIGAGFIAVVGDSNIFQCSTPNDFLAAFVTNADGDMI